MRGLFSVQPEPMGYKYLALHAYNNVLGGENYEILVGTKSDVVPLSLRNVGGTVVRIRHLRCLLHLFENLGRFLGEVGENQIGSSPANRQQGLHQSGLPL